MHDSGFRGEIALGYRENDTDDLRERGNFFPVQHETSVDVNGTLSAYTAMTNLLYEIDLNRLTGGGGVPSQFRPFLGGGIGVAVIDDSDETDAVLAYQVIGGVAYHFTANWAVTASYVYFATDDPEFGGVKAEYKSHNAMAGLRFNF